MEEMEMEEVKNLEEKKMEEVEIMYLSTDQKVFTEEELDDDDVEGKIFRFVGFIHNKEALLSHEWFHDVPKPGEKIREFKIPESPGDSIISITKIEKTFKFRPYKDVYKFITYKTNENQLTFLVQVKIISE